MADSLTVRWRRTPRDPRDREQGAALIEFVLVLPIFMMLILAMFTGGLAYSRKHSVSQAAREGARYGATLPFAGAYATVDPWLTEVARVTVASGDGELAGGESGQRVCVAYVRADGTANRRVETGGVPVFTNGACFADGRTEARVQVTTRRTSRFEALAFAYDATLQSTTVARFEALP